LEKIPIKIIDCIRQIQEQTGINVFFISGCHVGAAMPGLEALPPGTTVYLGASSKYPTTKERETYLLKELLTLIMTILILKKCKNNFSLGKF
jgi:hypothetical protein